MFSVLKGLLYVAAILTALMAWSYVNEAPYRSFRARVLADQAQVPFTRVIGTAQTADLGSPWSFIEPRTYLIAIASPDAITSGEFKVVSYRFEESELSNYIVHADCDSRTLRWFGEGSAEGASELARNYFGEPIIGPNGSPLGLIENVQPPEQWVSSLCDYDWTPEREALALDRGDAAIP